MRMRMWMGMRMAGRMQDCPSCTAPVPVLHSAAMHGPGERSSDGRCCIEEFPWQRRQGTPELGLKEGRKAQGSGCAGAQKSSRVQASSCPAQTGKRASACWGDRRAEPHAAEHGFTAEMQSRLW